MKRLSLLVCVVLSACGGAASNESVEAVAQPPGPRYLQYAPESSVGYIHADLVRLRESPHGERLRNLFGTLTSGADEAGLSLFASLDRGFIALTGGTATTELNADALVVTEGVPQDRVIGVLFDGLASATQGQVGSYPALRSEGVALVEVGPEAYVFGVEEQLARNMQDPSHRAPAFQTTAFVAVQHALPRTSVFDAIITLDGASPVGAPLGPMNGTLGAAVDVQDGLTAVLHGEFADGEQASRLVQALESLRQEALAHPLALVFAAQPILERISIQQDGGRVHAEATLTSEELARTIEQVGGLLVLGQDNGDEEAPEPTSIEPEAPPVETI